MEEDTEHWGKIQNHPVSLLNQINVKVHLNKLMPHTRLNPYQIEKKNICCFDLYQKHDIQIHYIYSGERYLNKIL